MTLLRKMGIGLFVTAVSFLVPIWIETQIQQGGRPSIGWQFVAYIFLTAAEDHGVHHVAGVRLHAGPEQDEIPHPGDQPAVDLAREHHRRRS